MKVGDQVGAYRILEHLGDGGMAEVWKVQHVAFSNKPPAALKLLISTYVRNAEVRQRFLEEAEIQNTLKHPNILQVHDLIMTEDHVGMVTDLADTDLSLHIQDTSGPIPWHLAKDLFLPLLDAVEHAHNNGIVHRDLKPSNVLLLRDGERLIPKLTDFGIAKHAGKSKTQTGSAMGTLAYMAPEQHIDAKNVDQRADIYALGMTLYEMLTGRVAFRAESDFALVKSKLEKAVPPPTTFYPHIPDVVERAVLAALAPKPEDRLKDCNALRMALTKGGGESQKQRVPSQEKSLRSQPEKKAVTGREPKTKQALLALGALGVLLILFAGMSYFRDSKALNEEAPTNEVRDFPLPPAIVPNPAHPVGMDAQFYESADVGRVTYRTVGIGADGSNAKMDSLKVAIDAAIKDKIANSPDEKKRYLGMREGFFASIDPHSFATEKKMLGSKRLDANRVTYTAMVEVHVANLRESLQAKGMVADDEDVADAIGNPSIVAVPSKSFRNPKLQTSAETRINEYLEVRGFEVLNRKGISDFREVVSVLGEIAGHKEHEAAQLALAVGAEVYITYATTVQTQGSDLKVEAQLRAYETSTGRDLADATGYSPTRPMGQAQVAMSEAISEASNKVIGLMMEKWREEARKGKAFFFTWRGDFSSGAVKNEIFQQMKGLGKTRNTLATDGTMQFIVKVKGDTSGLMFSFGSKVERMGCRVATHRGAMAVIICKD